MDILQVGQPAPHFSTMDEQRQIIRLEELHRDRNLLLTFIHGTWCHHCVQTLYTLRRAAHMFAKEGVGIAVVAIDDPADLRIFRQTAALPIPFTLLADNDQSVHKAYRLEQIGAYVALDQDGVIRAVFLDRDHHGYPGHSAIIQALSESPQ